MSNETQTLAERVELLASEVNTLRESIVTAAEWDAESRRVRQIALDTTLADVRWWLRVLVGVVLVLLVAAAALAIAILRLGG